MLEKNRYCKKCTLCRIISIAEESFVSKESQIIRKPASQKQVECCPKLQTFVVNDAELSSPQFIRAVQNFGYGLDVEPSRWHDFLLDCYCNAKQPIVCGCGYEVELNTELFEASDADIDEGRGDDIKEATRNWFRMRFGSAVSEGAHVFLTRPNREKFRVVSSILAAAFPDVACHWPRIKPANDNCPCFKAANDNFPQS